MEVTPGKQASEYHAIYVAAAMIILNGTEYVNVPWETMNIFLPIVTGGFIASRTIVKTVAAKAAAKAKETPDA